MGLENFLENKASLPGSKTLARFPPLSRFSPAKQVNMKKRKNSGSIKDKDERRLASASGFDDMTLLYKRSLQFIGVLPFEGRDFTYLGSRLCLAYFLTANIIDWSEFVVYLINELRIAKTTSVDAISETVMMVGLSTRYYLLLWARLQFSRLFDECREIWTLCDEREHSLVRPFERNARLLYQFLFVNILITNIAYFIGAASQTYQAARLADRLNDTARTPLYLPFKWYTEEGPYHWPGYKVIFSVQVVVVLSDCLTFVIIDVAAPFLIMMAAGYFRALGHRLSRISGKPDSEQDDDPRDELIPCLKLHQRILNFCSSIDDITRTLFLVQLMCTGYNISLAGIKLAGKDPDRYKFVPYVVLTVGHLFICQWAPDRLMDESSAIALAVYNGSPTWMKSPFGKLLVLVIARSQRPVQLTAAGIVNLSLEGFSKMLTNAVSFFTVLRSFNL